MKFNDLIKFNLQLLAIRSTPAGAILEFWLVGEGLQLALDLNKYLLYVQALRRLWWIIGFDKY